ncbi:hypothetical protein [Parerythrobacter jejuensis]|uniref:Uncharacterized protein n=1 Tax=Parerythrobacter jejuensis TaxID=795812 RepID=A0A845AQ67_9SPHN|nr:hypothetical protein [Parerythrobacter jejuensis]MXP32440.1 hypothetical protein [Parerythrobacter jejuensis]
MKLPGYLLQIAGLTMLLTGAWWILQGLGWIGDPESSYIAGQRDWAYIGATVLAIGGFLVTLARKFQRKD